MARDPSPRIPTRLKPDYFRLLRQGMTPTDAQAIIAMREGLSPGQGQLVPWTLAELVALEFVADRTRTKTP